MSKLLHVTSLVVGDWSGDGHDKKEITMIRSNLDSDQIMEAYKKASKKLGFSFIDEVANDYEDRSFEREKLKALSDAGMNLDSIFKYEHDVKEALAALSDEDSEGISLWSESYRDIYLFIISLGDPSFQFEIAEGTQLNIGGYGLFE